MKKYLRLAMCVVALACTTMMTSCEKEFLSGGGSETDELIGWWKINAESYSITYGERYSYGKELIAFFENNLMIMGDVAFRYTHDGDNITIYDGFCGEFYKLK